MRHALGEPINESKSQDSKKGKKKKKEGPKTMSLEEFNKQDSIDESAHGTNIIFMFIFIASNICRWLLNGGITLPLEHGNYVLTGCNSSNKYINQNWNSVIFGIIKVLIHCDALFHVMDPLSSPVLELL